MVRELLLPALVAAIAPLAGCSVILDFSPKAVPIDAAIDAVYSQDECDYKEPNDTLATAAIVVPGDTGPAAVCASSDGSEDDDYYQFAVPAGTTTVTITLDFIERPGGDLDLRLFDVSNGSMLSESVGFGNEEKIVCPGTSPSCVALAAGNYAFEVYPGEPGAVNDYTFSLALQ